MDIIDKFPFLHESVESLEHDYCCEILSSFSEIVDISTPFMQCVTSEVLATPLQKYVKEFVIKEVNHVAKLWNLKPIKEMSLTWNLSFYPKDCSNFDKECVILNHVYSSIGFKIVLSPNNINEHNFCMKHLLSNEITTMKVPQGKIIIFPSTFIYPVQICADNDLFIADGQVEF